MAQDNSIDRKNSYQKSLTKHGHSPKALQWNSYKSAAIRYREIVADVEFEGKSVLDAGCGMGDLLPYIIANSLEIEYLGVDITPELIDIASKRYVGYRFEVANPFDDSFVAKADIVVSSGVLNSFSDNWLEERKQRIAKLFSLASETLVFNMAGGTNSIEHTNKIAYANSSKILEFCLSLTPNVILRSDYHPKDFTIVMHK